MSKKTLEAKIILLLKGLKKTNASVSLHIIGDKKMTDLNFQYRGKKKPTDVLSFAVQEGHGGVASDDWGDIFICLPQVKRQAKEHNISWKEEFYRMTIHGTLHLFGYDHMEEKDAKKMFRLQEKFLSQIV
jgi:probable rRNA maturation factor